MARQVTSAPISLSGFVAAEGEICVLRPTAAVYDPDPNPAILLSNEAHAGGNVSSDTAHNRRRSTRVRLKVAIVAQGVAEPLTFEGETVTVNIHGALISTLVPLRVGMRIEIRVILTGKRATAEVVYVDSEQPRHCGIALAKPENIWGLSLPPDDWYENSDHDP